MKKYLLICTLLTLPILLTSCNNSNDTPEVSLEDFQAAMREELGLDEQINVPAEETKPIETKPIVLNELIVTEFAEYTINSVSFSYDVLPKTQNGFYSHYVPDQGKVYIDVELSVKNTEKRQVNANSVINFNADYNDGYTYSGFTVAEDKNSGFDIFTSIDPLETKSLRYIIECPQEVEETEHPLFLITQLDNTEYKYIIR